MDLPIPLAAMATMQALLNANYPNAVMDMLTRSSVQQMQESPKAVTTAWARVTHKNATVIVLVSSNAKFHNVAMDILTSSFFQLMQVQRNANPTSALQDVQGWRHVEYPTADVINKSIIRR